MSTDKKTTTTTTTYTVPAPTAPVSTTTTYTIPAATPAATSTSNPPPGVKDGGIWGKVNYIGDRTMMATCFGCLCFCIPGLLVLLCPIDKKDAYKVDGKIYDAAGGYLGSAGNMTFTATKPGSR